MSIVVQSIVPDPVIQPGPDEPELINRVVELIRIGMGLDADHVVAYNQMIPIPPDDGIFVAVGILDGKPYAASLSYSPGVGTDGITPLLLESQTLNERTVFSIHAMSKNNDVRRRRRDVIFALTNTRAQQWQDAHGFLIAKLPLGVVDSSVTEGASRLNRYTYTIAALSAYARQESVPYFQSPFSIAQVVTQN